MNNQPPKALSRKEKKALKKAERQATKHHSRSGLWTRKDFPRHIDGIWFESLEVYEAFYGVDDGSDPEDEPTPADKTYKHYQSYTSYTSNWSSTKLDIGAYKVEEHIRHMHYIVVRPTQNDYHAVWISCQDEKMVAEIMAVLLKPDQVWPLPVTRFESTDGKHNFIGNAYSGTACSGYWSAENSLFRGGESAWRIKDRIKRIVGPWSNWEMEDCKDIPPNVREAATKQMWHAGDGRCKCNYGKPSMKNCGCDNRIIPLPLHDRLRDWVKRGSPGWYGKKTYVSHEGKKEDKGPSTQLMLPNHEPVDISVGFKPPVHTTVDSETGCVESNVYFEGSHYNSIKRKFCRTITNEDTQTQS